MAKGTNDVWEVTMGPINPGAYRYNFNVDGVAVVDPRNPKTSESNDNTWSLVHVPGADWMDTKDVPHGAISEVTYWSSTLNRSRRLHVYTPPGYDQNPDRRYPVLYLQHGWGENEYGWGAQGRAREIMDNL
ncbi:MAG TPA: esterase, partial [Verrucomicrobiales bacterium]|nr:esterase [Verrucomicrobiales bacterium]